MGELIVYWFLLEFKSVGFFVAHREKNWLKIAAGEVRGYFLKENELLTYCKDL